MEQLGRAVSGHLAYIGIFTNNYYRDRKQDRFCIRVYELERVLVRMLCIS